MYQGKNTRSGGDSGDKRYKHYIHSPFTLEHQGVRVKVDDNGKIILTQDHEDGTFDEITTSASLINRLIRMLQATRKVVYKDVPFQGEVEEE